MPESTDELRGHIDAAHAAAEKLMREAEARARRAGEQTPPRGWDVPPEHQSDQSTGAAELATILALLDGIRGAIPAELSAQFAEAFRELLMAVRALIDWYLERLERPASASGSDDRVQDIPIQ